VPLGVIAPRVSEVGYGALEPLSVFLNEGVVPRSSRDDNHNQLGSDLEKYQRVLPGDLVFNKLRTWQGGFGVSAHVGVVSPAYLIGRPTGSVVPRYLHHFMRSEPVLAELTRLSKWMPPSQFDIGWDDIRNVVIALPPLDEQRTIADFLDDQVARIDTALAARARQRELAAETRKARLAALFSVGEDRKLRSLLIERPCYGVLVPRFVDSGGVSFIRVGDLGKLDAANTELPQIEPGQSAEYGRTVVEAGDLLVSVVGSIDKAAVVPVHRAGSNVARAVSRLRPVSESVARSLHAWMQTEAYLDQARLATGGDTAQPTLNMSDLSDFRIRLSDPDAVAVRAAEIIAEARVTDSALTRSIDLLNEYKRSLITAAVTGELDVMTARTGVPA
jgi:type I restriction enzyme S subunit